MESDTHFFTAHCKDDQLCGRSFVWVLVPKREEFRAPESGVFNVAMFQVEAVNAGFIIRVRDHIKDEIVCVVELEDGPYFSALSSDHVKMMMARMLYFVQWSDELLAGLELWFLCLRRLRKPGSVISDNFNLAFQQVIEGFFGNGIGLTEEERAENLAVEVEEWLNG